MASFTAAETEVMKILWEHGPLKPARIQDKYPRPIKNAALRFQLRVLLEKGHITREKVGKAYFYKALTPRKGSLKAMIQRLADIYAQGSTGGLIAELIKSEKLSTDELLHLRELAELRSAQQKPGRKKEKKS